MENKVICKDCKYFNPIRLFWLIPIKDSLAKCMKYRSDYTGYSKDSFSYCSTINNYGDCKGYELKIKVKK